MKTPHSLLSTPIFCTVMAYAVMTWQLGTGLQPARAAVLYWDTDASEAGNNAADGTGLGGTGSWDLTTASWWNGTTLDLWPNTNADLAVFSAPAPGGLLPVLNTVTLSSGITANELSFLRSGYLLTGGDLTLAGTAPTLGANLAEMATINSQILGTEGLTLLGSGGTVRLTNATNSYTGTTTISGGILSIDSSGALGADLSPIVVTGSATRGFIGGALMLAGGYRSGVTLARDVSLQGAGPVPATGAALLSIGNNTLTGTLSNGSGVLNTGIHAAGGRLTLTDAVITGTTGTTFLTVGSGSSLAGVPGSGSYAITGVLSGSGSIQKSGGGTLIIDPTAAADYTGTFRIYSGSMRFESVAAMGSNAGAGILSTFDLAGDGGILELRMDDPAIGKNVYNRAGGSPSIVVDHAIGSAVINGTAAFGVLTYDDGEILTFNGRNGYGASFGAAPVITGDGNSAITNNLNGTLTFTGDFWSDFNTTGSRTMTISGNGNTLIDGSVIATAAAFGHNLTKTGSGTLTITGTASTYGGNTTVSGGVLAVVDLGGINKNSATGSVILGSSTAAAAFQYTGGADTLAKPFSLGGTTGGGAILADGTGPLTITGTVGAGGVGIKTLFLGGGSSSGDNTFSGFLLDNTSTNTTGLMKIGSGTWVLQEPAAVNTGVSGSVTISAPGTTSTTTITLKSGTTAGMVVGETLVLSGSTQQITGIVDNTHFTIGTAVTNTTVDAGTYSVNVIPTASTATTGGTWSGPLNIANGVLKLQATNAASNIVPDANAVIFNLDTYTLNQTAGGTLEFVGVAGQATTETLGPLVPGTGAGTVKVTAGEGGTAALTFASLADSSSTTLSAAVSSSGTTTLSVASTAGLAPGMKLIAGGGVVAGYIVSVSSSTAVVVSATQKSLAVGTVLDFGPGNATVNYVPDANSSVVFASVPAVGLLNSSSYFNGADFAYAPSTVNAILRAPVYDTDAGFVTAAGMLTADSHNLVTGDAITDAVTVLSLKIDGTSGPAVIQNGLLTIRSGGADTSGGILVTGGAATISGAGVTTGGAGDLVIRVDGASDTLFLNAPVTATTTGGLIKTGAGTLVIGGVNAQTTGGTTQLQEGTIQLAVGGRLSANTVNFFMRQDTVFDLNGVNVSQSATTSSIGTFSGTGTVTNTSATPVIFAMAGSSGVFYGSIDEVNGQISVVKMGTSATQVFNGLSNYTGSTTIGVSGSGTSGTLSAFYLADIDHDSSIGRGDGSSLAANQGSLIFGGTTGGLVYIGNTSVSTDRLFTLAGTATTAGATITNNAVNNQALIFSNYGPIAFAAAKPQLFELGGNSSSDNWFNPQITDSGTGANITSFNKLGTGLWILGNTNNLYTGTTTITDGMLMAQDGTSLPNASGLIFGGTTTSGIFQSSGNFTRDLVPSASAGANTVSWSSALTTGGGGFAAATDKLVVAIGGLGSPTPLVWNVGGFMGTAATSTGPLVLNSITALGEVEFRNAIDLNGTARTIQVNDNTTTYTDFATLTGVISGNGGIIKTGTGLLQLLGDNTYTGTTAVTSGQLVVTSLGSTATPGASSLGDSTSANTQGNALTLGNAATTAGVLQYVGTGETSDRMIRLNTTTGSTQILADGSGPLILTNVLNDMTAGAKILYLRGGNVQGNMITSVLSNKGGNLTVTADQGATWILTGDNTYSGNTNITAGAVGAGSDTAFGTSTLALRNGSLFAYGAPRTLANAMSITTTTSGGTSTFIGDYDLTLNGGWNYTNTTTGHTLTNGMSAGTTLTLGGDMVFNALTGNVSLSINGSGNTVLNGDISTTTAFKVSISYSGNGTLTLNGVNPTAGTTTISNAAGTVILANDGAISGPLTLTSGTLESNGTDRVIAGNVTHGGTFIIGGTDKFTFNGTWLNNASSRTLTVNTTGGVELAGQVNLSEHLTIARTLTINGTGDALISGLISNGIGTGASALAYTGSGTLTLTNGANSYTGTTTLNNVNGTLRLTGAGKLSTGALTVNAGLLSIESVNQSVALLTMGNVAGTNATVNVAAGLTLSVTGVTFGGTTTLPATITGDGTLDLGSAGITVTVADNVTQAADMIWNIHTLAGSGAFTKAGTGTLDISGITNNSFTGSYLITAGAISGLDAANNNLALNGGVYQSSGSFARALGTGDDEVQILALGGGFAALGGDLTVTFTGAPDPLVWGGTASFVPDGAPLIFGSTTADSVTDFTPNLNLNGAVRTVSVVDNTSATTDVAVLSGVLSNGGITKTGNGVLELAGDNTFTGAITVSTGTLQFSTVSNNGGGPSNLGQGTDGITLGGGVLSFVGDGAASSQSTDRGIATTSSSTLSANGMNGAIISYAGPITQADNNSLTLAGTGEGVIRGGITQPAGTVTADLVVAAGTWTVQDSNATIADDIAVNGGTLNLQNMVMTLNDDVVITGVSSVLNLNTANVLAATSVTGTSSGLYARTGGTINLNADNVNGAGDSGGLDYIILADLGGPQTVVLNTNTFNITTPRLDLGQTGDGLEGSIVGSGTITVTAVAESTGINLYRGSVSANLAGHGALKKNGGGTVTLSGDNSGLNSAISGANVVNATIIVNGALILDYTSSNTDKISSAGGLEMRGGSLILNGNASAATSQTVKSFVVDGSAGDDNSGASTVMLNPGAGQEIVLNLGAITRTNTNRDGTVRFVLPAGMQSATNGITTSTTNTNDLLSVSGFATVDDGTGTWFATNATNLAGGNIVAFISTVKNDIATWSAGDHITDDTTGFTGTLAGLTINSLRFDAAGGSEVNISPDGILNIASGGILVTRNVGGTPGIQGGRLVSGVSELIITQDSAQTFEIGADLRSSQAMTKSGAGTLLLTGNNTYTDETEILQGTLQVSGGHAIGDSSMVTLNAYQNTTLELLDDETIGRLSGGQRATNADNGIVIVGTHTLTFNQNAASTYAGFLTGTGNLVKTGAFFDLTLSNLNTGFTGALRINGGGVILSGIGRIDASSIEINQGGYLRFADSSTTRSGTRILDATPITLNSANGGVAGNLLPRGLYINTDQGSTLDETVGVVTVGSGASYATLEATVAKASSDIVMGNLLRAKGATLDVRGTNLGTANTQVNQFRIGTAANQTAFIATLVGGGGTAAAQNISIVPWAIGETLAGAVAATNMGNSLVTYVSGAGLRPLDFATEYNTFTAAAATDNVRESLAADLTGLAGKTINALVLDNNATVNDLHFTGGGAGQALTSTSGTFLFTLDTAATDSTAYSTTLGGFDSGIAVGDTNEYVFFVVNPSSVATTATLTATIAAPLTSTADITKSGRGTLALSGSNTAGGGSMKTTINEGTLEISDLDNIGGSTGGLVFAGGALRLSSSYAGDDLSTRSITLLTGGGTVDTNGNDISFANAIGAGSSGGFTKAGEGVLTLNAQVAYTGTTTITEGTLAYGVADALPVNGGLALGGGTLDIGGFTSTVGSLFVSGSNAISGSAPLTFTGNVEVDGAVSTRSLDVNNSGLTTFSGDLFTLVNVGSSSRTLILSGSGDIAITGEIANGTAAGALAYTGSGTLTLTGVLTYTGLTTLNNDAGTLVFSGASQLSGRTLTVNAGTVQLNPAFDQSIGNLTMGGGAAGTTSNLIIGAGKTLTLAGTVTYSNTNSPLVATIDGGAGAILDFGGVVRTFNIGDSGNADPDMDISASITLQNDGGGGLTKTGNGTLHIGGANHLTGPIEIQAGAVTGDLGTGNLLLNNGVYEGNGTFTRSLGAGDGQVQWFAGANGGFAASGGDLTVTLAGAPDPLVWDSTPAFVSGTGALLFGSTTADSAVIFTQDIDLNNTGAAVTRTVSVNDNTHVTTDKAVLAGVLSESDAAASLNKTGNGILELAGANTFTGAVTVSTGTLQFSTVSNNGGGPSNLGQGTDGLTLSGGILSFIGDGVASSQSTDRGITVTVASTLNAAGTNGATITYTGAITAGALQVQLTGADGSAGFITGGIIQNTTSPDLLISSGNWTLSGAPVVVGDDFKINGIGTVLNLNTSGVLSYVSGTSNYLFLGNGSTVNLNAEDVGSAALGLEGILVGYETAGAVTTLNVNSHDVTTPRFDVGQIASGFEGDVIGSGTIHVTVTTAGSGLNLYRGSVSANLAGGGAFFKGGMGDIILSGDNSGLTGSIRLDAGNLILDYTTSNTDKINAATALDMRGGTVTIQGNASAATSQSVASFTLGSGGTDTIAVNDGAGQGAVLNLKAITRASGVQDGTVRFILPSGTQSATNGITTNTLNGTYGLLGLSGFATVTDSTGTWFATNATNLAGGNIVALTSTISNDVTTWLPGDNITDDTTGFTGTLTNANINSLRFNAAAGSGLNLAADGVLSIGSGGILVTDSVTSGTPGIFGGTLVSGVGEIIVTQDSGQTFEISSAISHNQAFTKTGAGTLLLSGSNDYFGVTELQAGTLLISGGNAIGDISLVTLADDHYSMLQLLADETIGRLAGGSAAAGLNDLATVDIGSHTLTLNQNAASTYAGILTGTGDLVKNGAQLDLTLSNASPGFTGALTINGGGVILSGTGTLGASSITVNHGSYLRIADSSSTRTGARIPDATPITLNSADGGASGSLLPRGLYINTDQGSTLDETVGVVTLGSGASYATLEATVAKASSDIIMDNLLRTHGATLDVRGTNLGTANMQVNQFRIGTAANQTAFIATLVGGGGAAASQNISIVPWAIGETLAGAVAATNMGNSLVTYVSGAGLRPLDFATEYNTFTAAAATDNVRESLAADLTGLAGKTINALVLDNHATVNDLHFTGSGAGQALTSTSGTFLFTLSTTAADGAAYSTTLGGFDSGIAVGNSGEYVFFVVNPSSVATAATLTATIASPLTSAADITKSGRGTLALSGVNTAGGGTFKTMLNEGSLQIADLDNIGGSTGSLVFAGGTLQLDAAAYSGDDLSTRTFTLLASGGTVDTNGNEIAFANAIGTGSAGGFTKAGAGVLTLNAQVGYTGDTGVSGGTLLYGIQDALPTTMNVTLAGGTLDVGAFTTALTGLTLLGDGTLAGSAPLAFTGEVQVDGAASRTLTVNNTSLTTFSDGVMYLVSTGTTARTMTINGTGDVLISSEITNGSATGGLAYSGSGTLTLAGSNSYTGSTNIDNGILRFTTDQNLAGALNFGSASTITTTGTLDLSSNSATFGGGLTAQTNSMDASQVLIGVGQTLTINGNVVIGSSAGAVTNTFLNASGGGSLVVTNLASSATFRVGGYTGSTAADGNLAAADLTGLASFQVSLNTTNGVFRVNNTSSQFTMGIYSLLKLAPNTSITAATLAVGDGGQYDGGAGQINQLLLGTGITELNVNTVNIGTGIRDLGSITFLDSIGSIVIRAADGVGAAAFNMGSGSASTSVVLPAGNRNTFDVSGHTADLLFGAMSIGTQNTRTGGLEDLFAFDKGTLTAGNLTMGSKTATGNSANVMNLGGGIVTLGSGTGAAATLGSNGNTGIVSAIINVTGGTVTIGSGSGQSLILGSSNTNGTGTTNTALNVSGGDVTLATTGATAVTMANASTGMATAAIDVSGGTLTVQGDIVRGTGAGTRNASVTLNGGTLDMSGKVIGASSNAITFNASSGTLKNLAELNGGGDLTKTTTGTLHMDGVNSYTGTTTVSAGTLQFLLETALYNNTPANWTDANIVVSSGATAAFNVGGTGEFTAPDVDAIKSLGTASGGFQNGSTLGLDTSHASGGNFTYGGVIADTNTGANSVGFEKLGGNTLVLTEASTYTGPTTVTAGTLQVGDGSSGALTGAGGVTVKLGATLSGSGSIAGSTVINSGGILAPGAGLPDTSNQTLTFTAATTALDVKDGGQIQLGLTSSTQTDAAFEASGSDALTYLNGNGGAAGTAYNDIWAQSGNYDSIKLSHGTFNLGTTTGGTIKVLDNSAALTLGSIFKLLDWSTVGTTNSLAGSGDFTLANLDLSDVALGAGLMFDTSAFTTYGVLVIVPEPSRLLLLMLGLGGFMLRRRRR